MLLKKRNRLWMCVCVCGEWCSLIRRMPSMSYGTKRVNIISPSDVWWIGRAMKKSPCGLFAVLTVVSAYLFTFMLHERRMCLCVVRRLPLAISLCARFTLCCIGVVLWPLPLLLSMSQNPLLSPPSPRRRSLSHSPTLQHRSTGLHPIKIHVGKATTNWME